MFVAAVKAHSRQQMKRGLSGIERLRMQGFPQRVLARRRSWEHFTHSEMADMAWDSYTNSLAVINMMVGLKVFNMPNTVEQVLHLREQPLL